LKQIRGFDTFEQTVQRLGKFKDPSRTLAPEDQKSIDAAEEKRKRKNEKRLTGSNRKT
jgi:hypothetical protein